MKGFRSYIEASFASAWAISAGIYIVLGLVGGLWVDRRFGTAPLFLLIGLFGGIVMSFYSIYRELVLLRQARAERRRGARSEGPGRSDSDSGEPKPPRDGGRPGRKGT